MTVASTSPAVTVAPALAAIPITLPAREAFSLVLHLHGFHHNNALASFDHITHRNQHAHYFSRHGRLYVLCSRQCAPPRDWRFQRRGSRTSTSKRKPLIVTTPSSTRA